MPIYHREIAQYSPAYDRLKLGLPTSSNFSKLITAVEGKRSSQWRTYAHHLIAERMLGRKDDSYTSPFMERGLILESEAVEWYEWVMGESPGGLDGPIQTIGFITTDDGTVGCTPDRLVGDAGLVEVKCPMPTAQVGYLLEGVDREHWPQLQGQLLVTEPDREWNDIIAYHGELDRAVVRVYRDEPYIKKLKHELEHLLDYIADSMAKIEAKRRGLPPPPDFAQRLSRRLTADPRQDGLDKLKEDLQASLAREDKARSAGTVEAQTEVVGDRPMPGVLPHQGPGESSAPLRKQSVGGGEPGANSQTWTCGTASCGMVFDSYSTFSKHRQRTGHKAEAKAVVGSIEREARAGPCAAGASGDAAPSPLSPRHPEFRHGKIGLQGTITREDARAYPDRLFVFGDNMARKGFGGQAKELRGEPNAVGIPTKWRPDMNEGAFFTNADWQRPEVQNAILEAFKRLEKHLEAGADVVYPAAGIGTGHAQLAQRAPTIAAHIGTRLAALAQVASIAEHTEQRPEALQAGRSSSGQDTGIATELQPANPETRVRVPPDSKDQVEESFSNKSSGGLTEGMLEEAFKVLRNPEAKHGGVVPAPPPEETFWDIAARSGDYKIEIPDKNIATLGRDTMMNLVADAPTVEALTAFYQGNLATIETMGKARVASRNELVKAMTRRKKELSGE